jgi:membrane protease YdiL (CAAX protease family)
MVSTCAVAVVYGVAWVLWGQPRDTFRTDRLVRDAVRGLVAGLALVGVFAVGALLVREMPLLAAPVEDLLAHASAGRLVPVALLTSVSGIAEELFYRRTVVITLPGGSRTRVIVALLLFMGVPLLVVAAAVLGIVAGVEAQRTQSLTSPIVLHVVWSLSMLLVLPTLLGAA